MKNVIEVQDLRKKYTSGWFRRPFEAIRGISFEVAQGEIFGLLGPNGAGKTTFIKVLLGIVRKSGGHVKLLEHEAGDRRSRKRIGYLPENLRIPQHHTARSALRYYGQLSGLSPSIIAEREQALFAQVDLERWADKSVKKFSKGMLQRLGLAQALLHEPEVLILDEPTDGLDPVGRNTVRQILESLRDQGKTVFLNSHLLQEVQLVCQRVAILNQGQLQFVGPIDEITAKQQRPEVSIEFIGSPDVVAQTLMDRLARAPECTNDRWHVVVRVADQAETDQVIDQLRQKNISIVRLTPTEVTLEEAFLNLVQEPQNLSGLTT